MDKINDGTIKIGDYVKYKPDVASTEIILQELGTYSGNTDNTKNTTSTLTQEMDLNWRVLDVKDGQVRLISDRSTTSKVTLYGTKGYNNAVKLLDDTCSTLYSNATLANKVQNLKIEDFQEYLTYDYTKYVNSNVDTEKYGGTKTYTDNKYYPNIFAKEKTGYINGKQGTEFDLSEQTTLINETKTLASTNIKITQTYWNKIISENEFESKIYYDLFVSNGSSYSYWMSSRCVSANPNHASFCVQSIGANIVNARTLCKSDGNEVSDEYSFRPVITLNSNVQIDTANSGNGSTAEQGYTLK